MPATKNVKNILVAEDEKPMARALELKLMRLGMNVKAVYNGQEALDAMEKEKFDMVLLDIMMPIKDGFGVLEWMKEKNIKTPVIMLSNLSQAEDEKRAKALGAVEFYIKSDTPIAKLVEHIQALLRA